MTVVTPQRLVVPGSADALEAVRDDDGHLRELRGAGRCYLAGDATGAVTVDDLLEYRETRSVDGFDRLVGAAGQRWRERYAWHGGRLVHVDGVDVRRDDTGRVVACLAGGVDPAPSGHRWVYGYAGPHLALIDGPWGARHVTTDAGRRPVAIRDGAGRRDLRYDARGVRRDLPAAPKGWQRDAAGRLWTVTDRAGTVVATYLWDGYRCLGRIDGPLGAPLAAWFSLDPSATPVRVVTRHGVRRVPRDAFGEGLLAESGVPGLFGGAVHRGVVHLPHRRLDPRSGAFCEPDPYDGTAEDPRRVPSGASGRRLWTGAVPVEAGDAGPYAVSRHDPVGRADPTGAISVPLVLSTPTWSSMNNIMSFIGMDWWFNLLASLFTWNSFGDFFSSESLSSSDRLGSFGVRRDGIVSGITGGRAFTTQHIVWTPAHELDELATGRVVDPQGAWEPTLYGSVIVARPEGTVPKVLRGMRNVAGYPSRDWLPSWTRAGGPAVPVAPGAVVPAFPSGGLHVDSEWTDLSEPTPTTLVEASPADPPAVGDLEDRTVMTMPADGPGLEPGDLVLLSDAANALVFATVASAGVVAGQRTVRLDEQVSGVGPAGVRLRELDPAPLSRMVHDRGPQPEMLEAAGPAPYAPDDLLRITPEPGGATLAARVDHLEAQLPLDRAVPAGFSTPLRVRATTAGAPLPATRRGVRSVGFSSDAVAPPVGSFALLRGGGAELAVAVVAQTGGDERSIDVDLDPVAAADGDTFEWLPLTAGAELGTRPDGGAEATATLTYRPLTAGTAPDGSGGSVVVRVDAAEGAAVRRVTGRPVYDAIVCDRAHPGGPPLVVERLRPQPGGLDRDGLTITTATALVLRPAIDPGGTAALRLLRLAGDPPTVGTADRAPGATVVDDRVDATMSATGPSPRPEPGEVVLLNGSELASVDRVAVAFTVDRDLDLPTDLDTGDIDIVPLVDDGVAWRGEIIAADRVRVFGEAWQLSSPTGTPDTTRPRRTVDLPRVGVGETVRLRSTSAGAITSDVYRVTAVTGSMITVAGGAALPVGATDVSVRRVVPDDPATGGSRLGRAGDVVGGRRLRVDVWDPSDLRSGTVIGVVAGDRMLPAVVEPINQDLTVTFTAPIGVAAGPVTIDTPTVRRAAHVTNFLRDGDVLLVTEPFDLTDAAGPIANDTIVAQRLVAVGDEASGRTLGGTLLVPEDEPVEIDRRQSLVDHELTHTLQYSYLGPWWFAFFPLWALELGIELGTDTDLPTYSAFVPATWTRDEQTVPGFGSLEFTGTALDLDVGDTVQLVRGSETRTMEVTSITDGIRLEGTGRLSTTPLDGPLQARVRNANPAWDAIFNILQHTSHGGLVSQLVGSTYGPVLFGIGKLFYALGRTIFGKGDLYPVTVSDDRRDLTLTDDPGREAFRGPTERMVTVRNGETTVVRRATRDGDVLHLDEPVPLGWEQVQAAPYDTHDPDSAWDWLDYHPARVPDPQLPHRIELLPVDGETPSLGIRDRVEVNYRGAGRRTTVMRVDGTFVELENPIVLQFDERSLRIAKVDEGDPLGNADAAAILALGMGWMRWLFDPWGQLQVRIDASETWQQVLLRTARYLFGSQSWSMLPLFGYVFYDRILFHSDQFGYRARIEQDAAEESGDLYSPLGRMFGEVSERDGFAQRGMVVGDIARYRYWLGARTDTVIDADRQNAPGVHLLGDELRWLAFVAQTAVSSAPNDTAESDTTQPTDRAMPDLLAQKDPTDPTVMPFSDPSAPTDTVGSNPRGLEPTQRALVPTSPTCQRTLSAYLAWTRPGTHRATTRNGITLAAEAMDLHQRGANGIPLLAFWEQQGLQTLWFDVIVSDVTVSLAGQAVAEGATVDLVVHQEATVVVGPVDGGRAYAVTTVDPDGGTVRSPRSFVVAAGASVGAEDVEISRVHRDSGGYASGGLATYGFHLGGDVHVPVRRFTANVVDTVPVRSAPAPEAAVVTEFAPGAEAFVLVPAAIVSPLRIATVDGTAPVAGADLPTITAVDPAGAAATFVGTAGAVFRITAPDDAPPAARALGLEVVVGPTGAGVPVTATLNWTT